jgi:multiple sugar transport system substrate-binding protein
MLGGCSSAGGSAAASPTVAPASATAEATAAPTEAATEEAATESPAEATTDTAASGDKVTIQTTLANPGEITDDQIAQFETQYPNIDVEVVQADDAKMAAMLATGDAPDVLRVNGAFDTPTKVMQGIWLDIQDRVANSTVIDMNDLLPVCNVYKYDLENKVQGQGDFYGLPKDWSNDCAVFYDKACFDAAGVTVPDNTTPLTWPQVMDLAKKLTIVDASGTVTQYGLSANEWGQTVPTYNSMMQYVVSAGQSDQLNSADYKTMNFDIPAVKDYINMWVDAVKANVGPSPLNGDQTSGGDLFLAGKSAMIIDGFWYQGSISGNADASAHIGDFGMLPTPIAPGGVRAASTTAASGLAIYAQSKHPDEAWDFFEWYIGGAPADDRAKSGWGMPITKSRMSMIPQNNDFQKEVYTVMQGELQNMGNPLPVNPYLGSGGEGAFDAYVTPLISDQETTDDVVTKLTADINKIIQDAINAMS